MFSILLLQNIVHVLPGSLKDGGCLHLFHVDDRVTCGVEGISALVGDNGSGYDSEVVCLGVGKHSGSGNVEKYSLPESVYVVRFL